MDSFSDDSKFYFSNIDNIDDNKTIYIYTENSECGDYHNQIYFEISNNKEALLERATEYFINKSIKTGKNILMKCLKI